MSPSLIRCLLAVLALSEAYDSVLSKDVARLLGIKRPTVHRSLAVLQEKGLIHKETYGDIHLTELGRETAQRMERHRDDLTLLFIRDFDLLKRNQRLLSRFSESPQHGLFHGKSKPHLGRK